MKPRCEVMVRRVFPAVRALMARELMTRLGHTQEEAAQKMGVTQPAISQYRRELRGKRAKLLKSNDAVFTIIKEMSGKVATSKTVGETGVMCSICREVVREGMMKEFA